MTLLLQQYREQEESRMILTGAAKVSWARRLLQRRPLFLDTETTTDDDQAEVIEVAVVADDGFVLLETLVRPQSPIAASARAVHGIGMEQLVGAPSMAAVWPCLLRLLGGRTVVAYNVAFDRRVLQQSALRYGLPPLDTEWVCLMEAYALLTGRTRVISLSAASRENGIAPREAHRAAADAQATLALVAAMASGRSGPSSAGPGFRVV
ncbi:MAG: 3'-5' exonuclease [Actinobacteria bacterium]|nr:3'-5' exonuclease [Actinomycetota bacterium]